MWTTTVDPSEYNIDEQMEDMVKVANKEKTYELMIDVGKVWGLYQAWKTLKEECNGTKENSI